MVKRKQISAGLRFSTLHRFGFKCAYCGTSSHDSEIVIDHINPVANGGGNSPENLVAACVECNLGKSDLIITETPGLPPVKRPSSVAVKLTINPVRDDTQWELEERIAATCLEWIRKYH